MFIADRYECLKRRIGVPSCCDDNSGTDLFTLPGIDLNVAARASSTTGKDLLCRSVNNAIEKVVNDILTSGGWVVPAFISSVKFSDKSEIVSLSSGSIQFTKTAEKPILSIHCLTICAEGDHGVTVTITDGDDSKEFITETNTKLCPDISTDQNELTVSWVSETAIDICVSAKKSCGCEYDCAKPCDENYCGCSGQESCEIKTITGENNNEGIYADVKLKCDFVQYLCECPDIVKDLIKWNTGYFLAVEVMSSTRSNEVQRMYTKYAELKKEFISLINSKIHSVVKSLKQAIHDDCCLDCGGVKYIQHAPRNDSERIHKGNW